jgi:hypothetical protein
MFEQPPSVTVSYHSMHGAVHPAQREREPRRVVELLLVLVLVLSPEARTGTGCTAAT